MERSKAESAFIDQRTRQILVDWANLAIINKGLKEEDLVTHTLPNLYFEHALQKGWLSKRVDNQGLRQLTAVGWQAAASFLKR